MISWRLLVFFSIITLCLGSLIPIPVADAANDIDFWNHIKQGNYHIATDIAADLGRTKSAYYALATVCAQNSFQYSKFQLYQTIFSDRGSRVKLKSLIQTWEKTYQNDPQVILFIGMVATSYPQAKLGDPNQRLIKIEPKLTHNAFLQNYRGLNELQRQNTASAKKYFQSAIALKPEYPEPYINLASLFLKENKSQKALEAFETALRKCPELPDYFYIGLASLISTEVKLKIQPNKGQPRIIAAPAIRSSFLERLKSWNTEAPHHLIRLAEYYAIRGNPDSAEKLLEEVTWDSGASGLYYYVLLHIHNLRGQEELVLLSAQLLLESELSDCIRLQRAGEVLFHLRHYDLARLFFAKSLDLTDPENYRVLFELYKNIGACYYLEAEYQKTIEYLEKALSYNPVDVSTLINLGLLFQNAGDKIKAKEFFTKALQSTEDPHKRMEITQYLNRI